MPRDSEVQVEIFNTVRDLAFRNAPDPEHMLWRITPFIDSPRDTGADGAAVPYDWRWEREWRVRGDLAFQNDDVAILFVPGAQHEWIHRMVEAGDDRRLGWLYATYRGPELASRTPPGSHCA